MINGLKQQQKCLEVEKTMLKIKIFLGGMPPNPPRMHSVFVWCYIIFRFFLCYSVSCLHWLIHGWNNYAYQPILSKLLQLDISLNIEKNSDNQVHLLKFFSLLNTYSHNKIVKLLSQQTGIDYFLIVWGRKIIYYKVNNNFSQCKHVWCTHRQACRMRILNST